MAGSGVFPAGAPLLELRDVTRHFPGVVALDRVSLSLLPGQVHALVGENGAGKSTLINIASGLIQPDSGQLLFLGRAVHWSNLIEARRAGVVAVHQEAELFATLSVAENMALETGLPTRAGGWVDWPTIRSQARAAAGLTGHPLDVTQLAGRLSVAERHLSQIAAAVQQKARVLVLDEPTAALTAAETEWLFDQIARLKADGVGILYISHRQEEIFRLANQITVLRDGRRVWHGPARETSSADVVRHMVGREPAALLPPTSGRTVATESPARLRVSRLSSADRRCRDISLTASGGEIVGLYGLVGSGRTELAQTLFGLRQRGSGTIEIDGQTREIQHPRDALRAGLAYVPEDRLRQGVFRGLSIRANAVLTLLRQMAPLGPVSVTAERRLTARQVEELSIKCRDVEQPIGQLSGGNQQKVVLARWLLTEPKILVLDEPTRGIDVSSKQEIHGLVRRLAAGGTAVVLISSDLNEVIQHADRIVVFREGRVAGQLASNEATAESIAALALPVESSSPEAPAHARTARSGPWWSSQHALAMAILLLATALACTRDAFLTRSNLETLATNTAGLAILSLGAAAIILAGAIDISLGSLLALAAGVAGLVLEQPGAPAVVVPLGIAAGLAVGLTGGLANAGLSLLGRIHPIVVTLGTMTVYRALLISLTGGETIAGLPREFTRLTGTLAPGVTGATIVGLMVAAGMYAWSTYRRSGRYLLAYGSSPSAARLVGIRQTRVWLLAFSTGGLLAAVAGLLELAQTGAMQSSLGVGYELQAIAAAVIGGVSISGGRGSMLGVCLGAVLLSLIHNAFVLWQIPGQQYSLVTGGLLLGAILLDAPWRRGRA